MTEVKGAPRKRAGNTAETVFRREWGRAVAVVARLTDDLGLAEDAVQEAFAVALDRWAVGPLPRDPAGWLITVARNHALDQLRRESRRTRKEEAAMRMLSERDPPGPAGMIVDDRLRLIFACCHPALDPATRVALTLRTLCGLTTAEIARSFLVSEPAMAQRLVRAKRKIRDAAEGWHLLHACRADLLRRLGRTAEAADAYRAALALDPPPAEREFLTRRMSEVLRPTLKGRLLWPPPRKA